MLVGAALLAIALVLATQFVLSEVLGHTVGNVAAAVSLAGPGEHLVDQSWAEPPLKCPLSDRDAAVGEPLRGFFLRLQLDGPASSGRSGAVKLTFLSGRNRLHVFHLLRSISN
jgi:hypothetical protein